VHDRHKVSILQPKKQANPPCYVLSKGHSHHHTSNHVLHAKSSLNPKGHSRHYTPDHFFCAEPSIFPHAARGPRKPDPRLSRPDRQGTGRADDEAGPEAFSGDEHVVLSGLQGLMVKCQGYTTSPPTLSNNADPGSVL
jgi:hypothetical protein